MEWLHWAKDVLFHLDRHLNEWSATLGVWFYVVLFLIVFVETGLVIWPFLPGDSLLFAVGALAASADSKISLPVIIPLLCLAANLGDLLNYRIGYWLGPAVFKRPKSKFFNVEHLHRAQRFYEKHGRKTIILARFVPIVRTFAPFVAGIGWMPFSRFILFSIAGGVFWVTTMTLAGYFFGQIEFVKKHFEIVVLMIIAISLVPVVVEVIKAKYGAKEEVAVADKVGD